MSPLQDDQATADTARDVATRLLAASREAIADGADVPVELVEVFPTAYGWWRFICRSAEAFLLLSEEGLSLEAAPVLRNVFNHAYALHWLVDNGPLAVEALVANSIDGADKLCTKLEQSGWPNAAEYRRLVDRRKARAAVTRTDADDRLLSKLKHEVGNFYDMLDRYASADVYPVYSHLSGLSHTSVETANAYLEWLDDRTMQIRESADGLGYPATIQLAMALLQAAFLMNSFLNGYPMQASIEGNWIGCVGIQ